ncbi:MAG: phosphoglycolate phosphatase [Pseudomonadota bacterium]
MAGSSKKYAPFEAALFDLDGTLVDTAPDLAHALNQCLAEDGHAPFAVDDMRNLVGHGAAALLRRGYALREGKPLSEERLTQLRRRFLEFYGRDICVHSKPFDGVEDVLDSLSEAGIMCGICTNKPHQMALSLIDALGWQTRFKAIVGGDYFDVKKPDPRHITGLLEVMNCPDAQSFFIGDSDADYDAAQAAGVPAMIVRFGYSAQPVEDFKNAVLLDHYSAFDDAFAGLQSRAVAL